MDSPLSVEQVEQFATRLYSGEKAATAEFMSKGWAGLGRELGITGLTAVLGRSQSTSAIVFSCRVLSECLEQLFLSTDELASFLVALVGVAAQRCGKLAAPALMAMCGVASTAMKRGHRHTPAVRVMVSQLASTVATASGTEAESTHQVTVACHVLAGLVDAMGERRFSHVAEDLSDARQFRDGDLLSTFTAVSTCVKKQRVQWGEASAATAAVHAALQLLDKVIFYDFTCVIGTGDAKSEKAPGPFPSSWNAALTDRALIDRLWALFKVPSPSSFSSSSPTSLPPYQTVLHILSALSGLKSDSFVVPDATPAACVEARRRWLDQTLLQTHVVMERGLHCKCEDILLAFVRVLACVKPGYTIDELLSSDHFGNWVTSLHRFTTQCFQTSVTADSAAVTQAVAVLLEVWARLCGAAASYATADTTFLSNSGKETLRQYLQNCALERGEWYARNEAGALASIPGKSEFGATSYPLEDDAGSVVDELRLCVELAMCCGGANSADNKKTWGLLADFVNVQYRQFEDAASGRADTDVFSAVEGAAWVLRLCAACINSDSASATAVLGCDSAGAGEPGVVALGSLLIESFLLVDLSARTPLLDSVHSFAIRSHFEEAAVVFLNVATSRLVLQRGNGRSGLALAHLIDNRLVQCRLKQPEDDLAVFLLDAVAQKVWVILSAANVREVTRARALDLFETMTESPTAVRILRVTAARQRWFASLVPESLPTSLSLVPGAYNAEQAHARYQYIRCVARVSLVAMPATDTASQVSELAELLGAVVDVLPRPQRDVTVEVLMGALIDLRGVLSCATRRAYQIIWGAVGPLFPDLLQRTVTKDSIGSALPVHVLRLTQELSSNRSQRIFFGANSTAPYELFRTLSSSVGAFTPVILEAFHVAHTTTGPSLASDGSTSDAEEWAWACLDVLLRLSRNALHGGYCNLGVFRLYADPALETLVVSAWKLLASCSYAELAVRPTALEAAVSFANELCDGFFAWVWASGAAPERRLVAGLIEATAFPADATVLSLQAAALEALNRLVACCSADTAEGRDFALCLTAGDPAIFKRLLSTCLEWAMSPQNARSSGSRLDVSSAGEGAHQQLLFSVLSDLLQLMSLRDESGLADVRDFFTSRCQTNAASEAIAMAFNTSRTAFEPLPPTANTVATATSARREAAKELVAVLRSYF